MSNSKKDSYLRKLFRRISNTHNVKIKQVVHDFGTFKKYKILQFSDLHVANFDVEHVDYLVSLINSQDVDFVVFTGDVVCNKHTELTPEILHSLSKIRHIVYAILGNHDYDLYTRSTKREKVVSFRKILHKLTSIGWIYLVNEHTTFEELQIVGTDDFGHDKWALNRGDIRKACKNIDTSMKTIVLTHNPSYADDIIEHCSPSLILCGHTHAGQIGYDFSIMNKRFCWSFSSSRKYWKDLYETEKTRVYVNRGTGYDILPLRTFYAEFTIHLIQ